jgi:hypothetical protein
MRAQLFFLSITFCLLNTVGFTQVVAERVDEKQIGSSRYFIGKERELLMSVNVLGPVGRPGEYTVPSQTDLVSLIAYAGGFQENAKINDIKIIRSKGDQKEPDIIKINLEKFYASGDQRQTPLLLPDDTVIIANRKVVTTRTVTEVVRGIAYVAEVVYIFFLISKE